jgi:hypothetical protein
MSHAPLPSDDRRIDHRLTAGPIAHKPRVFLSFAKYFSTFTGKCPPTPITIPWSLSWSIKAPEFNDGDDAEAAQASPSCSSSSPVVCVFASVGEFARSVLGVIALSFTRHIFWNLKSPILSPATVTPSTNQDMAFRLVDPAPFLPLGMQRMIVPGRPVMRHVVVGHVPQSNNDLTIVQLHPMPAAHVNFMDIWNVVEDFLREQNIGFCSMQLTPLGQAYVRFNYMHERDMLIHNSPHPYGNGTFYPHTIELGIIVLP